jgi:uncharacterized membrane protein
MRKFTVRPPLTLKGRTFKGLRGWAGKPFHPPLTDIPVAAYVLAAVFDIISVIGGRDHAWGREFYRAATFTLIGGLLVSVPTALTGFWDWLRSTTKGTQARRTANTHAWIMLTVTALTAANVAIRYFTYDDRAHVEPVNLVLSLVVAGLVSLGATYGGSLVYDYGFNVETGGDHPVWHVSEQDVFPGNH